MAARLVAWLAVRSDRALEGHAAPYGNALALGAWYASEGGYVDWARSFARGSAGDAFGRGVQDVVTAADAVRMELDARFVTGFEAWVAAGRPTRDVVPIDQALGRIAAPFLAGAEERRLLVLLMDGMAWAQAVELLQSIGERSRAFGPLAWHGTVEGRVGPAPFPAVFVTIPTTTEVSRAAFFAGRPMRAGERLAAGQDPARFEAHPQMRALCGEAQTPRLLLRAEGSAAAGAATQEALSLVGDEQRRVVGIVVNVIDASLKRDPQQHPRWDVDAIKPLADLLDAAHSAGRAVLFASDHGHVPTDLLTRVDGGTGSARWRDAGDAALGEHELRLAGDGVWAPKADEGVVVLTGERARYAKSPTAGEQGGLSLAEVVAPCLLIGSALRDVSDDAQRVVGAHVPQWWLLRVPAEEGEALPKKSRRGKRVPDSQLALSAVAPAQAKRRSAPPAHDLTAHPLMRSTLFTSLAKGPIREQALRAVEFLSAKKGVASQQAFAAATGVLAYRVPGVVSHLQEVLNVEGFPILSFDPVDQQVRLDIEKLEQQFEVKR